MRVATTITRPESVQRGWSMLPGDDELTIPAGRICPDRSQSPKLLFGAY
jgi:hypothetical protein